LTFVERKKEKREVCEFFHSFFFVEEEGETKKGD
jgi:hypothetical protein